MTKQNNARKRRGKGGRCFVFLLLALSFALCGCSDFDAERRGDGAAENMTVTVLDIGKADAILLQHGGQNILIDCGEAEDTEKVNAALRESKVEKIDLLVLTHLDKDHIGGAANILQNFAVKEVIQSANDTDSKDYRAYLSALEETGVFREKLSEEKKLLFSKLEMKLLPAREESYADDNNYSIMIEVSFGDTKFLFAGDAEKKRLSEYLETNPGSFDFLKVPHHGKAEENSALFFETISPRFAVITCSKKNPPDEETLLLLERIGAQVFLTEEGVVRAISNGEEILFE